MSIQYNNNQHEYKPSIAQNNMNKHNHMQQASETITIIHIYVPFVSFEAKNQSIYVNFVQCLNNNITSNKLCATPWQSHDTQ